MARVPELAKFAKAHKLKMVTIKALIEYRMQRETFVRRMASARLPTMFGDFEAVAFENELDGITHIASGERARRGRRSHPGACALGLFDCRCAGIVAVRLSRPAP